MSFTTLSQSWDPRTDLEIQDPSQRQLTCSGTCSSWDRDGMRCRVRLSEIARLEIDGLLTQIGAMHRSEMLGRRGQQLLYDLARFALCEGPQSREGQANRDWRGHRRLPKQIDTLLQKWTHIIKRQIGNNIGWNSATSSVSPSPRAQQATPSSSSYLPVSELEGSGAPLQPAHSYSNPHAWHKHKNYQGSYVSTYPSPSAFDVRNDYYGQSPRTQPDAPFSGSYTTTNLGAPTAHTGYFHQSKHDWAAVQHDRPQKGFIRKLFRRRHQDRTLD
jgi:hypothetical protein